MNSPFFTETRSETRVQHEPTATYFVVCAIRAAVFILAIYVSDKLIKRAVRKGIQEAWREREKDEACKQEQDRHQ